MGKAQLEKSSNKLRMKALVGWNTLHQVPELINIIVFFTRIKNDITNVDEIAWDSLTLANEMIDTARVFRCKHQCFTPMVLKSVVDASLITFGS